jgi:hypothetical protein
MYLKLVPFLYAGNTRSATIKCGSNIGLRLSSAPFPQTNGAQNTWGLSESGCHSHRVDN